MPEEDIKQPEAVQPEQEQPKEEKTPETPVIDTTLPDVPSAPVTESVQPPEISLNVDPATAMNLTVQEFDKKIAEAEAGVYDLKRQKAAYIYDTNVQALIASAQRQQQPVEGTEVK